MAESIELQNEPELHEAHIVAYVEYHDAMEWEMSCEQMKRAEGEWEDNGCLSQYAGW